MRKYLLLLMFCLLSRGAFLEAHEHGYTFDIFQKDYWFSTGFEMESQKKFEGLVCKSSLRWLKALRDTYDIYDQEGNWQATGTGRIFCLGFFRPWGAEFDITDKDGDIIGVIDGQVVTGSSAKFSIYNAQGDCVGIAYLDRNNSGFSITHPEKETLILGRLVRNFVQDQTDHWTISMYDTDKIDPRIIKVFAAFAVDKQAYFKEDR